MLNKEIEFKYRAQKLNVRDFIKICKTRIDVDYLVINGKDDFYNSKQDSTGFFRYRVDDNNKQLTFKRKLNPKNNIVRTEYNLNIKDNPCAFIPAFLADIGYYYNTSIKKTSFIFTTNKYTIVYYICRNEDEYEIGRFLEIEMSETFPWKNVAQANKELRKLEKRFSILGIGPKKRVKDSLWEMFKKEK